MTKPTKPPLILLDLPMPIATPRLLLRPPQVGDGQSIHEAKRESWAELHKWMIWVRKPLDEMTLEEDEAFARVKQVEFMLREDLTLLIFDRQSGKYIGGSGLHRCNWERRHFSAGYWIRTGETGKGYATEAAAALVHYAFGALGAKKVACLHAEGNDGSRRVIEKTGFKPEGVLRKQHGLPDGSLVDEHMYGLLAGEPLPPLDVKWG